MLEDCLHLKGLRCYGYTGYLPEEQTLGQWFEVNLTLWLDLAIVGQSDRLTDTLDYRRAISQIETLIKTQTFATVERLTTAIAESLLKLSPPGPSIHRVRVQLTKLSPPIPDFTGNITVDLTRDRADFKL